MEGGSNQVYHNYFDLRKYFELSAFEILRENCISNAISNLSKEVRTLSLGH